MNIRKNGKFGKELYWENFEYWEDFKSMGRMGRL